MLEIEKDKSYVVFSEEFLSSFDAGVIADGSMLRTSELCLVVDELSEKTPFYDEVIDSAKLQFLNGEDYVLVPIIYQTLGRVKVIGGRKLIPSEEDIHIFDNIDFEKEFKFSL